MVDCDASDYGLEAVISQRQNETEKVIAYASQVLEDRERLYSTNKKEMLAMVYAIKHFRHYLYGRPFTVRTDHNALRWLQSFKEPEGQVARWLETLAQYDYKIEHRPELGKDTRMPMHYQGTLCQLQCSTKKLRLTQLDSS